MEFIQFITLNLISSLNYHINFSLSYSNKERINKTEFESINPTQNINTIENQQRKEKGQEPHFSLLRGWLQVMIHGCAP